MNPPTPFSVRPVALVTGASRGIGRAIALGLARAGFAVVVNYSASEAAAREVCESIVAAGGTAVAVGADVSQSLDRKKLIAATIEAYGRLDLLVNNAAITSPGRLDLLAATEENWDRVFALNLKGPFFLSQAAVARMLPLIHSGKISGAKIINISSISAFAISTDRADYCLTKAALGMMTGLFAARLADEKIQVFEVCPGLIATDMTASVQAKYDRQIAEGLMPMRRWGAPEDVAQAVVAIATDAFPFSTGERIHVDGGFHLRRL
ncbi:MAG TPA: 3-ketoacyl-ACP reductase [Pirellulales bacterium]|jgi:NAD(P)-dependent dehydrogenase (short-subunit alcohol dehydrogenase family)|nr:3-ketoacyl-ACP reductase [Pirellulales bacterium]